METSYLDCCDVCGEDHSTEECPELGFEAVDASVDTLNTRARLTLPDFLTLVSNLEGDVRIVARQPIENKFRFGPFEAKRTTHIFEDEGFFTLKVIAKDGATVCLDTTDENECNWMCLVDAASMEQEQNLMAYQIGTNIFYSTICDIGAGQELRVWYSKHYARKLGKPEVPDGKHKILLGHRIEPLQPESEDLPADSETSPNPSTDVNTIDEVMLDEIQLEMVKDTPKKQSKEEITFGVPCPRCELEFQTQSAMAKHLRRHILLVKDRASYSPFLPLQNGKSSRNQEQGLGMKETQGLLCPKCVTCDLFFDTFPELIRHVENQSKECVLGCGHCKETTSSLEIFKEHMLREHQIQVHRGRGRPRKSEQKKVPASEDGKKEKYKAPEKEDEEVEYPESSDEESGTPAKKIKLEKGIYKRDDDYSPNAPAVVPGRRVMPRRENRGKSKYDTALYVIGLKIKREPGTELPPQGANVSVATDTPIVDTIITPKRKRGRPKKMTSESFEANGMKGEREEGEITDDIGELVVIEQDDLHDANLVKVVDAGAEGLVKGNDLSSSGLVKTGQMSSAEREQTVLCVGEKEKMEKQDLIGISTEGAVSGNTVMEEILTEDEVKQMTQEIREKQAILVNSKKETGVEIPWSETLPAVQEGNLPLTSEEETVVEVDIEDMVLGESSEQAVDNANTQLVQNVDQQSIDEISMKHNQEEDVVDHDYTDNRNQDLATDEDENQQIHEDQQDVTETEDQGVSRGKENKEDIPMYIVKYTNGNVAYACKICNKKFSQLQYLKIHAPAHTDKNKCKECGQRFTRRENLNKHRCKNSSVAVEEKDMEDPENFTCDICHQSFTTAKYLHRHMVMHTDIFKCEKCQKCFSRKDSLQRHIIKCCPELCRRYQIFHCDKCMKIFGTKMGRENHMMKCVSQKCNVCLRIFSNKEDLDQHECSQTDVGGEGFSSIEYSCGKCGKSFLNMNYLNRHKLSHEGLYSCTQCSKSFTREEDLKHHEGICAAVQDIKKGHKGSCSVCGETFNRSKLLREHYQTHTHPHQCSSCLKRFVKIGTLKNHLCSESSGSAEKEMFQCSECERVFTNERYLARHMSIHGEPKYKCDFCSQTFYRKDLFCDHTCKLEDGTNVRLQRRNGEMLITEKLVCDHCGKSFISKSNLNKHMKIHGEKSCTCELCGKKFHFLAYLQQHMITVHDNALKFQCTFCGKMMKSKTGLIAHTRQFHTHADEEYPCKTCGKIFKQKGNLRTHMYAHETERKFACNFCAKKFKFPDQLSRHKLIHTMMNKLQCSHCDKKFCKGYELKKHIMVFHSGYVYICGICQARCGHRHTLVRHYKRKHPNKTSVLQEDGYIESLLKHIDNIQDEAGGEQTTIEEQHVYQIETQPLQNLLPQMAAEALQNLSHGTVTQEQGIVGAEDKANIIVTGSDQAYATLIHSEQDLVNIVEHAGIANQQGISVAEEDIVSNEQTIITNEMSAVVSTENATVINENSINIDGQNAITFHNLHGLQTQTIEGLGTGDDQIGQIVILQIVDQDAGQESIQVQDIQVQ